jgi:hypothetical protein
MTFRGGDRRLVGGERRGGGRVEGGDVGGAGGDGVGEGGVAFEDEAAGAVLAELADFLVAEDGECVQDVGGVVGVEAVEVEEGRVELGAEDGAAFRVPAEGRAGVADVCREAHHVVRGKGQFQYA